jgi:hypothetical protein
MYTVYPLLVTAAPSGVVYWMRKISWTCRSVAAGPVDSTLASRRVADLHPAEQSTVPGAVWDRSVLLFCGHVSALARIGALEATLLPGTVGFFITDSQ